MLILSSVQKAPDPSMVSPGFAGFLAVFLLTAATILLIRSMVKRLRGVRYRAEQEERAASAERPSGDERTRNGS